MGVLGAWRKMEANESRGRLNDRQCTWTDLNQHQTPELESWSGYSEAEAVAMGAMLSRLAQEPLPLVGTRRLTALTRKYASSRYREVAAHTVLPLF